MIGITIPTYNNFSGLVKLISQIYERTNGKFKLYVVEDGQNPDVVEWLKEQKFKVVFHKTNKGIAPSWNDGLRLAVKDGCDYFAFFNDDIEIPENWWDICQEHFNRYKLDILGLKEPCPIPLTGWFFIFNKRCFDKVGYFDEQFAPYLSEDSDYIYRCFYAGMRFAKINLNVIHEGSHTINQIASKNHTEFRRIAGENWRKLRKKFPGLRFQG